MPRQDLKLYRGDFMKILPRLNAKSVDLICTDLPYGTTQNKWDIVIPFEPMWAEFNRIIRDHGVIVLTATMPFAAQLIVSNLKFFRYDMVWEKTISSGQLNVRKMPMRSHELILVFYKKLPVYNEQKTPGKSYRITRTITTNANYGTQRKHSKVNDGFRHARSVLKISNPRVKGGHPTQKPMQLMETLIKMYSNPGQVVLDCCMGSGTTGEAAKRLNRKFIGVELDKKYFQIAKQRISHKTDPLLAWAENA
jgi:site-specific DNA-methyltransferase (adenine-specific)